MLRVEPTAPTDRARLLFRWCLTREPTADELRDLAEYYETQRARCQQKPADAKAITGVETTIDPAQLAELAAWTLVGRAIMNLDEFVTKE